MFCDQIFSLNKIQTPDLNGSAEGLMHGSSLLKIHPIHQKG